MRVLPRFVERVFAHQVSVYREMHRLLRQTKKRGKDNPDFEALAKQSANADALIAMHDMPRREAELQRWVQGCMEECSTLGLPTPRAVLQFNRELSGITQESDMGEKHAFFYQCLADEPTGTDQSIAQRISEHVGPVSRMTVNKWRSEPHIEAFMEATDRRRLLGISPVNPLAVDDADRHLQTRIELKAFRKKYRSFKDRACALQDLDEIRRRRIAARTR